VTSGDVIQLPIAFVNGTRLNWDANITAKAADGLGVSAIGEKSGLSVPRAGSGA
jgi:hypothetical protein